MPDFSTLAPVPFDLCHFVLYQNYCAYTAKIPLFYNNKEHFFKRLFKYQFVELTPLVLSTGTLQNFCPTGNWWVMKFKTFPIVNCTLIKEPDVSKYLYILINAFARRNLIIHTYIVEEIRGYPSRNGKVDITITCKISKHLCMVYSVCVKFRFCSLAAHLHILYL